MTRAATKAVVMAAGRGTRMRDGAGSSRAPETGGATPPLDEAQRRAAGRGRKSLIPFHGHPFLSYVLTEVAEAGIEEVCLVVGPGADPVRRYYETAGAERLRIRFEVQDRPLGTADALLAAEPFAADDPIVVLNADNLYPASVVEAVRSIDGNGLAGFRARGLHERGNIPRGRIASFAVVTRDRRGCLAEIVEKPAPGRALLPLLDPERTPRSSARHRAPPPEEPLVSMTLWRFTPAIFAACRRTPLSSRGELELPDAVMALAQAPEGTGACVRVLPVEDGVLDLTHPEDIPVVAARLRGREVHL